MKRQNTLIAALIAAISATGTVRAQSNFDINQRRQRQQLESLEYEVDRLNGKIESDRAQREWDQFDAELAAKRAAQQAHAAIQQQENDNFWRTMRADAARLGYVIDNRGWKPKLIPVTPEAKQRAAYLQEEEDIIKQPMVISYYSPKAPKYLPEEGLIAWTIFAERRQGDRKREVDRVARKWKGARWREIERERIERRVWFVTVEFYRKKR